MKHPFQVILLVVALTMAACQTVPVPSLPTAIPPVDTQAPKPAVPTSTQAPAPAPTQSATAEPTKPVVVERPPDDQLVTISTKARITAPNVPADDERELAQGNNAFAVDLYRALPAQDNLFFSPLSISQALAMTYAGARGETEQQMAKTLHFTLPQDRLHPAFNALDLALRPAGTPAEGQFQLNIANSLWGQKGYAFQPAFLDLLAENYGAGLRLTDYKTAPEPARLAINQWVSDQTKDKIKDLIPAGAITPDTRLVLANAIYFYAKWRYPFDGSLTQPGNFNLLDGSTVSVPMMSLGHVTGLRYATGSGFQAVELPYAGEKMALTLIVPDAGRLAEVRAALSASQLEAVWRSLETKQVQLSLPKFKYESSFSLGKTLSDLGMPDALTPNVADFSGMDGTRDLAISDILHKAVVAVDEEGTEAAAATAVIVGVTSLPVIDVQLTVDRPFIFVIRDTQTGTVLFMGQMLNPK